MVLFMAMNLPKSEDVRAYGKRALHPRTKLGRTTLWFGYLALALELLRLITRSPAGTMLSGWAAFISYVFVFFAILLGFRWLRQRLMWRLRNRLIVTYVFIGVIPVILLVMMALLAGYLFAGQFATYVAMSDLQSELHHLEATNKSLTTQFRSLSRSGNLNPQLAAEIASASDENFRHRSVTVWDGDKGFVLAEPGRGAAQVPIKLSPAIGGDFAGFVLDQNRVQLRAVKKATDGTHQLTVISNVPITPELLRQAAVELGSVTLLPPDRETIVKPTAGSNPKGIEITADKDHVTTKFGGETVRVNTSGDDSKGSKRVEAGTVPPPSNSLDFHFPFATRFDVIDWGTAETLRGLLLVDTRPSLLYATLFSSLGENAGIFIQVLIGIGIFLGIIELIALFVGVRLTRSVTKSIAELYSATQYVNRGELSHRIQVRSRDQMAALEQSFNSMTQSLGNLITEQKEKQRLEGELAIAHEVQALLFPADLSGLRTLEVHGVCRPARTVSGDYYDFIPLREERLMIALGDISGKGISAALLMATIYAAVRAYSIEDVPVLREAATVGAGVERAAGGSAFMLASESRGADVSPATLLALLNHQLYESTPAAKYATLFLGIYDGATRRLTYSNGGHLQPILISDDGSSQLLTCGGTVVGLFDNLSFPEATVQLRPGDMLVAYTDGVTEPENDYGEFGEERLIQLVRANRHLPLERITEIVAAAVADWIGENEQPDDVTLVLARAR